MRIAAITPASNQDYSQFDNWKKYYSNYVELVQMHIIIDNDCNSQYAQEIRESFPGSIILKANGNIGTTGAFNLGVEFALKDKSIDGILLIVQDVAPDKNAIPNLVAQLKESEIGVVSGVVLYGQNPDLVEWFGGKIELSNFTVTPYFRGKKFEELPEFLDVDFVPGGVNLSKREVYEKVGLQDIKLFMYCDEIDWDLRVKSAGYKIVVTNKSLFWHNHLIDPSHQKQNRRRAYFYDARNRIYLIRKYHGFENMLFFALRYYLRYPRTIGSLVFHHKMDELFNQVLPQALGIVFGVLNIMGPRLYRQ